MQSIAERAGSLLIHGLVGIYAAVERLCTRRDATYATMTWEAIDLDTNSMHYANEFHELNRVNADVILHHIVKYHGFHSDHKTIVQWVKEAGQGYTLECVFDAPSPPWFYIGYIEDGNSVDCTSGLDNLVVTGNRVTPEILYHVQPSSKGKTWVYVNPKTFDQVEFPSEGILIGGDATPSSTKDD
jgi:hypothetical protein